MTAVFRYTVRNLAARPVRLLMTALAIVLGVTFMAGTLVLTDTMRHGFDQLVADANADTDVIVRAPTPFASSFASNSRPRIAASLVDTVRAVPGVASVEGVLRGPLPIAGADGKVVEAGLGETSSGMSWITDDRLDPFHLVAGRAPTSDGEVAVDRGTARRAHLAPGDRTTVYGHDGPRPVTVVGVVAFGTADSPLGESYVLVPPSALPALLGVDGVVDGIRVVGADGISADTLAARVRRAVGPDVQTITGAEVTRESQRRVGDQLDTYARFLVVFALIALLVGSFVIFNAYAIVVAQRRHELALLRAIGATRRQVLRSVLGEALATGAAGSVVGLGLGCAAAAGLRALLGAMGLGLPNGALVVTGTTVGVCMVLGTLVAVASAALPARAAGRVPPVSAMRAAAIDTSAASRVRACIGALVAMVGLATLGDGALRSDSAAAVGAGSVLVLIGAVVLGPSLLGPIAALLGRPARAAKGAVGAIASANAARNPRRAATTASALTIGVSLVVAVTVLASALRSTAADGVERSFTGDYVVRAGGHMATGGLTDATVDQLTVTTGVRAVVASASTMVEIDGEATMLTGVDTARVDDLVRFDETAGTVAGLAPGQIAVDDDAARDRHVEVGDQVPLTFVDAGFRPMTVGAIYRHGELFGSFVVRLDDLRDLVHDEALTQALVGTDRATDPVAVRAGIESVLTASPQARLYDREGIRSSQAAALDPIVNLVYGLLALAVVIALLGITNAVGLSVFERTRELGLLRAVGMTRPQVRATVRWEAVTIALFGAIVGVAVGTVAGGALARTVASGASVARPPVAHLAALLLAAALAGALAAVVPARRAARLDVLDAVAAT